jgi:hypothetical protein
MFEKKRMTRSGKGVQPTDPLRVVSHGGVRGGVVSGALRLVPVDDLLHVGGKRLL